MDYVLRLCAFDASLQSVCCHLLCICILVAYQVGTAHHLVGTQTGCNTSAYWGFLAQILLCGSKNPLIDYGIFRLWENTHVCASNKFVVHCRALYIAYSVTWFLFLITGKLLWTDGLKER